MKLFWTIAVALLAAACTPVQWMRADADPAQASADSRECQMQAWQEARWRSFSYAPPLYLYRDAFGRPSLGPHGRFADPFGDRFMEESRLASFCMRAKGYELQPTN